MSRKKFSKLVLILFLTLSNFKVNLVSIDGKEINESKELVKSETSDYKDSNKGLKSSNNISISFDYKWNDTSKLERPELVTFRIFASYNPNVPYKEFSIVDDRNYDYMKLSEIVPKYFNGNEVEYFIEIAPVKGYETIIEGDYKTGYKIEFIKTSENVNIDVSHNFIDFNNEYNKRPETVEVNLMKKIPNGKVNKVETVNLSDANDWKHRFNNLPKYRLDNIIEYFIEVKTINEYKSVIEKNALNDYIINSTIDIKLVDFNVKLNFKDSNDITEKRPENVEYNIYRQFANGQEQFYRKISQKSNEDLNLRLPENEKGHSITYSIREENVEGYEIKVKKDSRNNYTIDYNLLGDKTSAFFEVKFSNDENHIDFARPDELLIILEGENIKGEYVMIDTLNINASDDWKGKFTNLPRLLNGELIKYRVSANVNGYKTSLEIDSGLVHIINLEFLNNTYAVMVKTKWNDFDNRDKMRPQSINLKITGTVKDDITIIDESINAEEGTILLMLKKYYKGELINYDFTAADTEYYTNSISGDINDGISLISTYKDEKSKTSFTINWIDEDNNDGLRPDDLDFAVFRNESGTDVLQDQGVVSGDNNWNFTFANLSKYYDNYYSIYSFKFLTPEGYTLKSLITSGDETVATLVLEVEKISINVDNEFFDNSNNDGKRPKELVIKLLSKDANNVVTHDTIVLKDGNTKTIFKDLRRVLMQAKKLIII